MRLPLLLLISAFVLVAGCETQTVKREYVPLKRLLKSERFKGYEIVQGPVIKRTQDGEFQELAGPFRLSPRVDHKVTRETKDLFHRRLYLNQAGDKFPKNDPGIAYEFKHENSASYGFMFVGVENEERELGVILLKTTGLVPEFNERHKEEIERLQQRRDRKRKSAAESKARRQAEAEKKAKE